MPRRELHNRRQAGWLARLDPRVGGLLLRTRGRWAGELRLLAIVLVSGLTGVSLLPEASRGADALPAPATADSSGQSTNQPVTNAPAVKEPPTIPKPPVGTPERYPPAFHKFAPASVDDLKAMETQFESIVARVSPAVVAVLVGGASGSAIVISEDGLVLCAAHVCSSPGRTVVFTFPDGKTANGKTLGTDHETDAGLMRITDPGPWPHVPVGNPDAMRLGDWVLALGHPGGFDPQRATDARIGRIIVLTSGLLQTDCTLLGGDSGGPVFDMSGRVIGIHSRISESTEANFHVPISAFMASWDRLARGENWGELRPSRPYVGANGVDDPAGCRLERIDSNSPASRAGLKVGDIVTQVNDRPITGSGSFQQSIGRIRPGTDVTLQIKRDSKEMSVRVTVGTRGGRGGRGRGRGGP